ncbi:hypothetical protein PYW08_012815 [Mythimna loreyi]|uniref:Uncharacterized protein n=1 Tax=Mythimna loreyi TaxID=667449 RepID=A0ACC2Q3N0_9NEOP|nr:hypothetical protein PYW08_012815 [Mythimna loreyi]
MSDNNVINGKKKALLAYKEKILDEIKYCEKSIDDLLANFKNKNFYDVPADSSDSEDDFPSLANMGPSVTQLKLQESMSNTCLHATEELTSLTVLQSSVELLVEEPKFEREPPVKEAGTWREVIAECRIDLVHFSMSFYMHTPDRKFGQASYRGLRVVPVKHTHELELAKSVLHSLRLPSDAVEVMKSYAAGYRSRRTTLARLADKYNNALFMEPHPEGGFVLKCADLLEVSWRLENKRSPVAPFHHAMKFDLEFMEEAYVKIISQAHKQLLNPALPTDERTLLLAKIIATCLEARGPIDPESDLESKTTERDNEIDKRDSEVMAPPKSLPKKSKQKSKEVNTAQKRSIDDENSDTRAKKLKTDAIEANKNITDTSNPRKTKINDGDTESGKKRKINEVASAKNVKESGNTQDGNVNNKEEDKEGTKSKNAKQSGNHGKAKNSKEIEDNNVNKNSKTSNAKESISNDDKNTKTKNQIVKETGDSVNKEKNTKSKNKNLKESAKNLKEPVNVDGNTKSKSKIDEETAKNQDNDNREEILNINTKNVDKNKGSVTKIVEKNNKGVEKNKVSDTKIAEKNYKDVDKNKNSATKNDEKNNKNVEKNKASVNKIVEKDAKNDDKNKGSATKINPKEPANAGKVKNVVNKPKNIPTKTNENSEENNQNDKTKNNEQKKSKTVVNTKSKENVDTNKNAGNPKSKVSEKLTINEKNTQKIDNKPTDIDSAKAKNVANTKTDKQATKKISENNINVANTKNDEQPKKVSEKKVANKVSEVADKEKNIKEKTVNTNIKNTAQTVKKVTEKNATNLRIKDKISQINKVTEKLLKNVPEKVLNANKTKEPTINTKNIIKKPPITRIASHRNSLKPLNPPKLLKTGNTKPVSTGNTEKENGGKGSKIPQKKMSIASEGSSKKNMLRISPRKLPSKFKTTSQDLFKQKMMKSTNIPRLLKKPAPKMT